MNLLTEAQELGESVAWMHNKEMDTGVVGAVDTARIRDALERLEVIMNIVGPAAERAYADAYDATIDFSLNAAWREAPDTDESPPRLDVPF